MPVPIHTTTAFSGLAKGDRPLSIHPKVSDGGEGEEGSICCADVRRPAHHHSRAAIARTSTSKTRGSFIWATLKRR